MPDAAASAARPCLPGPKSPRALGWRVREGIVKTGSFSNVYESRRYYQLRILHISLNQWKIGKRRSLNPGHHAPFFGDPIFSAIPCCGNDSPRLIAVAQERQWPRKTWPRKTVAQKTVAQKDSGPRDVV